MTPPVIMVANGDLRLSANQACWAAQSRTEEQVARAVSALGREVRRGHAYDALKRHGFIDSQKCGIEVFRSIPKQAPLLNLNACLRKAGVRFDSLWSANFDDEFFLRGLARWLNGQPVEHEPDPREAAIYADLFPRFRDLYFKLGADGGMRSLA